MERTSTILRPLPVMRWYSSMVRRTWAGLPRSVIHLRRIFFGAAGVLIELPAGESGDGHGAALLFIEQLSMYKCCYKSNIVNIFLLPQFAESVWEALRANAQAPLISAE